MPWNMFLAWLPLMFALGILWASYESKSKFRRFMALAFGGMWLFFYPNSPYMLTNFIHLNRYNFIADYGYTANPSVWLGFLHLISGVGVGVAFGMLSLVMLQRLVAEKRGAVWGWLLVGGVSALSGVAIWIGRNLRFNSWDIAFRPFYLLRNIVEAFNINAFWLCVWFAIMSGGVYLLLRVFLQRNEKSED
jgi:uncharacterized membrane protein